MKQVTEYIKRSQASATVLILLGALSVPAMSAGVGKVTINNTNTQMNNEGTIEANSKASKGSSQAVAGQRVIAPVIAGVAKYTSTNDKFYNQGTIKADSTASGGVSTAAAGQVVVAPLAVVHLDYRSRNNEYRNSGQIKATSKASGGVSTAVAGQDVHL